MIDPNKAEEFDWSLCTRKGSRRQQHKEFHALPFSRKLELIEEMNALVASRQDAQQSETSAVVREQPKQD